MLAATLYAAMAYASRWLQGTDGACGLLVSNRRPGSNGMGGLGYAAQPSMAQSFELTPDAGPGIELGNTECKKDHLQRFDSRSVSASMAASIRERRTCVASPGSQAL